MNIGKYMNLFGHSERHCDFTNRPFTHYRFDYIKLFIFIPFLYELHVFLLQRAKCNTT